MMLTALLLVVLLPAVMAQGAEKIRIVFRYDDFSSRSPNDLEERLIECFERRGMPLTVGIIPFVVQLDWHDPAAQDLLPLPMWKMKILKDAVDSGIVEPAVHGYSHQTNRNDPGEGYAEFAGLSFDEQRRRISASKKFLEEGLQRCVDIFIPPWNRYDQNTLAGLELSGFHVLSASLSGPGDQRSSLSFIPHTAGLDSLRKAVESARRCSSESPAIIVLFHSYDFSQVDPVRGHWTWKEFERILSWTDSAEDLEATTMSELAREGTFDAGLYEENRAYDRDRKILPAFLSRLLGFGNGVLYGHAYLSAHRLRMSAAILGFAAFLIGITVLTSKALFEYLKTRFVLPSGMILLPLLTLLAVFSFLILKDRTISSRGLSILSILGGLFGGAVAAWKRPRSIAGDGREREWRGTDISLGKTGRPRRR